MNDKEVKEYVDALVDRLCGNKFKREEIIESIIIELVYQYEMKKLTKEDLAKCSKYLNYPLDIKEVDKTIKNRKENLQK